MVVYACMCEQTLNCEYFIKLCVGAMQFSLLMDCPHFIFPEIFFQNMMHILGSLMLSATRSFFLCHSKSNIALFRHPDEHVNKTKCTAVYHVGFKV